MSDMTRLERELTAQLAHRADAAQPPDQAWSSYLRARTERLRDGGEISVNGTAIEVELVEAQSNGGSMNMTRNRWMGGLVAVVAAAILIVGVVSLRDDDVTTVADVDPTVPTVQASNDGGDPADVLGEFFDAFASGDVDAVMALFSADATFADSFSGQSSRDEYAVFTAWDIAQGVVYVEPECVLGEERGDVVCLYGDHSYIARAVGAPPVSITTRATVVDGQISTITTAFGQPDYTSVGSPFDAWIAANHPDVADQVGCCAGATQDESRTRGELRIEYADLWAAYLDDNNCTYNTRC